MQGKKKRKVAPNQIRRPTASATKASDSRAVPAKLEDVIRIYERFPFHRIGSDISFMEFADEIDPPLVASIAKCQLP